MCDKQGQSLSNKPVKSIWDKPGQALCNSLLTGALRCGQGRGGRAVLGHVMAGLVAQGGHAWYSRKSTVLHGHKFTEPVGIRGCFVSIWRACGLWG